VPPLNYIRKGKGKIRKLVLWKMEILLANINKYAHCRQRLQGSHLTTALLWGK